MEYDLNFNFIDYHVCFDTKLITESDYIDLIESRFYYKLQIVPGFTIIDYIYIRIFNPKIVFKVDFPFNGTYPCYSLTLQLSKTIENCEINFTEECSEKIRDFIVPVIINFIQEKNLEDYKKIHLFEKDYIIDFDDDDTK